MIDLDDPRAVELTREVLHRLVSLLPTLDGIAVSQTIVRDETKQEDLDARDQCGWIDPVEYRAECIRNARFCVALRARQGATVDASVVEAFEALLFGRLTRSGYLALVGDPPPLEAEIIRDGRVVVPFGRA